MKDVADSRVDRDRFSASELRKLPLHERNAILEVQAAEAEHEYRADPQLTDFEAFGEEDLDDGQSPAETR